MGLAYLPDGRRMDYEDYLKTSEWRKKKNERLAFDNWRCGICHAELPETGYETHHINYSRLGNENVETDLISICRDCHATFHEMWQKSNKWESVPLLHWKDYSLKDTAKLCAMYQSEDILLGGEYNLCAMDTIQGFIDRYFVENSITDPARISEDDVRMCIRNLRYDLFFKANDQESFELESWLDSRYGPKGGKGGNPLRAEARRFFTKHKLGAMKRIYKENDNTNILMKEVRNYAETIRI